MRLHFSAIALGFAGTLAAQVPYGDTILSNFSNLAPMEGLLMVKRTGATQLVTGLAGTARGSNDINSIQLDPIDNRVWIGGITASAGRVDTLTVSAANTVANFAAVGNVGTGSSVAGLAFDANGNPIAASGAITGTGGLFRFDRKTSAVTRIVGGAAFPVAGTCNCVCSDPAGSLYFAVTGTTAPIYRVDPGPNGDYLAAPVPLGSVFPPSSSSTISSIEYVPASGARPARVWWTTFGTAGTAVGYIPAGGGAAVVAGPLGGNSAPNWVDYDNLNDDMVVLTGGIDPDTLFKVDHAGNPVQIATVPPGGANGSPSANDANDIPEATTAIIPQYLPAAGTIDIEVGTACKPGRIGGVLIISPVSVLLVAGTVGADGRVWVKFPNLSVPRGTPNTIKLQSICFDTTTGFTFGPIVLWPKN